ncbi:hypothetical protein CH274_26250 [Rhodococcus sp. 06-418-5]|nr:hypothetical protein CH274_26250 [Rhodococcus sp. 06-418-5]
MPVEDVTQKVFDGALAGDPCSDTAGLAHEDFRLTLDYLPELLDQLGSSGQTYGSDHSTIEGQRKCGAGEAALQASYVGARVTACAVGFYDHDRRLVELADASPLAAAEDDPGGVGDQHVVPDDLGDVHCDLLRQLGTEHDELPSD